ncbi:MAG: hypothetical protein GX275_01850 [Clostridiales bacterium]|nr:hypothetical protein [Clostridiales bacterium]
MESLNFNFSHKVWQIVELGDIVITKNPETGEIWTQGENSEENMGYIVVSQKYVAFDGLKLQKYQRIWEQNPDGSWGAPEFKLDEEGNKIPLSFSMTIPMEKDEAKGLVAGQRYLPSFMKGAIVRTLSKSPIKGFTEVINPITKEATGMYQSKKIHLGLSIEQFNLLNNKVIEESTNILPINVNQAMEQIGIAFNNEGLDEDEE